METMAGGRGMIRQWVRSLTPQFIRKVRRRWINQNFNRLYGELSPGEAFTKIYREAAWGKGADDDFYSGAGSHAPEIVEPYVAAVGKFLASLDRKPDVVDLGCGDFFIGSQLRHLCGRYVACDVVEPLIERNRARFPGVEFRVLDVTKGELPDGEIAFIRQVLQHLSNDDILQVLPKLSRYKYVIVSEHLPSDPMFRPNVDKPIGPDVRADVLNSGVVLTAAPFRLSVSRESTLCEVPAVEGKVVTTLYQVN